MAMGVHGDPDPATVLEQLGWAIDRHDLDALVASFAPDCPVESPALCWLFIHPGGLGWIKRYGIGCQAPRPCVCQGVTRRCYGTGAHLP